MSMRSLTRGMLGPPGDPAHHVADDVRAAVDLIMKVEAERAHEESMSRAREQPCHA